MADTPSADPLAHKKTSFNVNDGIWAAVDGDSASSGKARENGLTTPQVVELLLAGYTKGTIRVTPGRYIRGRSRSPHVVSITRRTHKAATEKVAAERSPDGIRSLSHLAEILLSAYARGDIVITAAGHACDDVIKQ
ncbi:hypothetical protein ACFY12_21330 [Streptomyces sp. NPDC001339]|uniref:hypothetical protein n=1 Tax=Streptomyces sp. NPDC001339 TaxID=3364563 RepID=UPI0036988F65